MEKNESCCLEIKVQDGEFPVRISKEWQRAQLKERDKRK